MTPLWFVFKNWRALKSFEFFYFLFFFECLDRYIYFKNFLSRLKIRIKQLNNLIRVVNQS